MKYLQELKNAVDFLLHDIRSRKPQTIVEIQSDLELLNQYEEIRKYLYCLDETVIKPVIQTVNLFAVKKILDPLFERGLISIRAKQIVGSNMYIAEAMINDSSTPTHLRVLVSWPGEYSDPDLAISNLKTMLGV